MPKITKSLADRLQAKEKSYFVFDDQITGFCLRVSPNGKRFYYLQYMKNKKVKRLPLGQHGIITAEKARDQALQMLVDVKKGGDPQREASDQKREPYMSDLCERYMAEHVEVYCKPRTKVGYQWLLRRAILPYFRDMQVSKVTRADVAAFHHSMRATPYNANRALEMVSKMFELAELWGLRPDGSNPRKKLKKYSFGAFMTFCQIERNNAEERVKKLLKGDYKPASIQPASEDIAPAVPDEAFAATNLEELARDQLAASIIRKFKGDKLEMLVEAILKAQGFTTYRSPTGTDKGVDLLAAPGTLGFGTPRICVQVKSSDSPVDRPTLDQLVGTMKRVI